MAIAELEKDEDIVVLSFNGWLFEGYEDAKTALMGTILEELPSHRNFLRKATEGAKKLGKRLLHRANLLKVLSAAGKIAFAAKTAGIAPLLFDLSASSDIVETGKQLSENLPQSSGWKRRHLKTPTRSTASVKPSANSGKTSVSF